MKSINFNFRSDGLGMRLYNAIPNLYILHKYYNYKINAYWPDNCQCYAHFLDLFENVCNINFVSETFGPTNPNLDLLVHKENINSANSFSKHNLSFYRAMLQPKPDILNDSLRLIKKYNLNKNTYGLYLRCPESFDFRLHLNKEPVPSNKSFNGRSDQLISYLKFFESQHELHDKRILLISDSETLNNYLLSKYKNMFTVPENVLPNHECFPPRRSKESIISALKCCFLLKSCTRLNTKQISSFSHLPNWLAKIN